MFRPRHINVCIERDISVETPFFERSNEYAHETLCLTSKSHGPVRVRVHDFFRRRRELPKDPTPNLCVAVAFG